MAPSKLRKAIGAVKDQTSISLAKVGGGASISDLDVAIVKATRHDEYPPDEKHIEDILLLTANNSRNVEACIHTISKRLNKTRDWVVAIKALMLVNRLLNDGDRAFAEAVFYTTRRETRLLDMTYFKDSRPDYHDYSAFVRSYASYVDAKVKFGKPSGNAKLGSVVHDLLAYPKDERESFPLTDRVMQTRGRTIYRLAAEAASRRERKDNSFHNRENSLSPRRGTRRYDAYEDRDRKNGLSLAKVRSGADNGDSPFLMMTTPRHGRRNSPSPTRSRRDRGNSPSSARATPRHDRKNSPSPVRASSRGYREDSPSSARATPRHGRKNSPSPTRGRSRHDKRTSPSPNLENNTSPQRTRPGRDRRNSPSPERATPRRDGEYGPSPRRARTRGDRNISPPTRAIVRHDMNKSPRTPMRDGMNSPMGGARQRRERKTSISPARGTPMADRSNEELFSRMKRLVHLLDCFLACHPTGMAKAHRIVFAALCQVVKESFRIYIHITELLSIFVDRFDSFDVIESVEAYKIFQHVAHQFYELYKFYEWCDNIGIARQYDYPDVHQIPQEKLDTMAEYIRDKTSLDSKKETSETEDKKSEIIEEDMNAIKALPPPEEFNEEPEEQKEEDVKQDEKPIIQTEADLLGLGQSTTAVEDYGEKLALALFDGAAPETEPWEAFKDTDNWETALVQSTSYLSNQKASFPGGFDTMLLNGMYQHGAATQAANAMGYSSSGSPSSVALGSAGRPMALALPPPPGANALTTIDPFAASLVVPPPSYVQMSELENKQKLLVQEQLMWQQFSREGMQGQIGLPTVQPNPFTYNMGGYYYTNTY